MADMNYVSPLTSDLTDYYTKSEVDELQQGDAATYATSAEIVAGDNAVKGWVVSQGFLTEHQDLTNYATISYVDDAIAAIEPSSGGMAVRVVSTLPGVGEENVLYLVFVDNEDEDNRYAEYIWVDALNDYEMLGYGSSEGGIIPDLTDYATKQWVEAKGYLVSSDLIGYATVSDLADFATKDYVDGELANKADSSELAAVATSGDYDDLINKPTLTGYATEAYVNNAVAAIDIPDVSGFLDDEDLTAIQNQMSLKADASSLSTVATTGSYNDLTNKPTIPSISGLATETYVDNAVAGISVPANTSDLTNDSGFITSADLPDTSGFVESSDLATVATTGDYDDLTNKPTIPVLPTLATVATSGSYNDLSDKPTIPTTTGITSSAINTLFQIVNYGDSTTYAFITTSNDDNVRLFNSGYAIQMGANTTIQLTPEEAILNGAANSNRFRKYYISNNGEVSVNNDSPSNGYYTIYGYSSYVVQRISPNAYIVAQSSSAYQAFIKKMLLTYDNTTSGLSATTIQEAIDELAASAGSSVGYTYDSTTKTVSLSGVSDDNL